MSTDPATITSPQGFDCPECRTPLSLGVSACPSCGLRLTGPLAARLWQLDQQILRLSVEARELRQRLLLPPDEAELAALRSEQSRATAAAGGPVGFSAHPGVAQPPARSISGQQILLGLGALLLLSGLAFFVAVAWFLVGVVGQAAIMVALTGLAAAGAVLATRKRLPAAAETAAVVASGLVAIDLWAAHGLGLAGLDAVRADLYWAVAGLVGGALLLGFDSLVPRRDATGELPRISVYRPAALWFALAAVWAGFAATDPTMVAASAGLLVVAAASLALGWFLVRLDGRRGRPSVWLVGPAAVSAGVALLFHVGSAVGIGYDDNSAVQRYGAMALLLVLPALLLAARRQAWVRARPALSTRFALVASLLVAGALGIPLMEVPRGVVVAVAVALGAVLTVLALRGQDVSEVPEGPGPQGQPMAWGEVITWVGRLTLLVIFWFTFLLVEERAETGLAMRAFEHAAPIAAWWLPVLPAVALLVPTVISAVRRDSPVLTLGAEVLGLLAVVVALRDAESLLWVVVGLTVALLLVAVAAVARMAALEGRNASTEAISLIFAAVAAFAALVASFDHTALTQACVLVGTGAALLAYAALPGRLGFAFGGTLAVTWGVGLVLDEQGVTAVEFYTAPAVLLLAATGVVHWWRDRSAPTMVTMAPAIAAGLYPSLLVAIQDGPPLRLLAVTVLSMVLLGLGLARRWQAPVVLAGLALVWIAVTQGGPVLEYVPRWALLVLAGTALLVAGVMWERSIALGRRTVAWFSALR